MNETKTVVVCVGKRRAAQVTSAKRDVDIATSVAGSLAATSITEDERRLMENGLLHVSVQSEDSVEDVDDIGNLIISANLDIFQIARIIANKKLGFPKSRKYVNEILGKVVSVVGSVVQKLNKAIRLNGSWIVEWSPPSIVKKSHILREIVCHVYMQRGWITNYDEERQTFLLCRNETT